MASAAVPRRRSRSPKRQGAVSNFDASTWKGQFEASSTVDKQRLRKEIFKDTLRVIEEGSYCLPGGTLHGWEVHLQNRADHAEAPLLLGIPPQVTRVVVKNMDTLEAARELILEGYGDVLVLNMASKEKPGGVARCSSQGQEDSLCRRSNLWQRLKEEPYPLMSGILTKDVEVFRGPEDEGYPFLPVPFMIQVASVAAKRLEKKRRQTAAEKEQMRTKIQWLLSAVKQHRSSSAMRTAAVLGPLGCGFCNHLSEEVAELFYEELQRVPCLGTVVFAILDGTGSIFEPFRAVLETQ